MDRQRPAVFAAAIISLLMAVFALVMAWTTADDGTSAAPAASAGTPAASDATPAASDASGPTFDVTIEDFTFTPGDATVAPGTTVVFTNRDSFAHSIVSDDDAFPSSPHLEQGDTYEVVLTEPGTYAYSCGIHPTMHGTITVEG